MKYNEGKCDKCKAVGSIIKGLCMRHYQSLMHKLRKIKNYEKNNSK